MLNNIPILLERAQQKSISPHEFSLRWRALRSSVEEYCLELQHEFLQVRAQAHGCTSRAHIDKLLKRPNQRQIEALELFVFCIENWLEQRGGSAYLQRAKEAFAVAEKLWYGRIKALKAIWEGRR